MIRFKVSLLGAYAVGKTSLVRRFVHAVFDERYHTTIGVKIDKKTLGVSVGGGAPRPASLVLWDIHGEDDFQRVRASYLRGSSGLLLVLDGTRRATLDVALELEERAFREVGPVPTRVLLNKCDLVEAWELDAAEVARASGGRWEPRVTSARTGLGVEATFQSLAEELVASAGEEAADG